MINLLMEEGMAKVLIVDDSVFVIKQLSSILSENGHEIIGTAKNGEEALQKYKELHPDVVTLDITMPGMSGVDVLKQLLTEDPNAKVVMVTALGRDDIVKECLMAGAKAFVVKPLDPAKVIEVINKVAG